MATWARFVRLRICLFCSHDVAFGISAMPRALRSDFAGEIYHALNRGNARNKIFFKEGDFEAFERVIQQGLERYPIDLIAYQWMSNHWHLSLIHI